MTTTTDTRPTASADPAEVLSNAEVDLFNVTTAHRVAREASDAARAALAELEAAADRGEKVDTDEYTRRKADLGLKSRRTAALAGQVATAQAAVDAAQEALETARIVDMADAVPDPEKARQKALKAVREYLTALDAQAEATNALFTAARGLPDVEHPSPEGATGWPCWTFTGGTRPPRLEGRIGHLIINGRKFAHVHRPEIGKRLADEIARLAQQKSS